MSRPRGRRGALVAATMLTASLALAGCSAGMVTQTDTQLSQAPGAFGDVGNLSLRDITLEAGPSQVVAPGDQVGLAGMITNQDFASDRLVSVTTPYAQSVTPEGTTEIPGNSAVRLVGSEPGPTQPATPVTAGTLRLSLTGVTQAMRPGPTYPVTFTFERAGTVTVPVIVTGGGTSPS